MSAPRADRPPRSVWQEAMEAKLGPLVWAPLGLQGYVRRGRRVLFSWGLIASLTGLASLGAASLLVGPNGYSAATLAFAGGALLLGSGLLLMRAAQLRPPAPFAVFTHGAFVSSSVQSVPGLERVGGPRLVLWGDLDRVEDLRKPEGRAVLLWTGSGEAGVASIPREAPLKEAERDALLDKFFEAVEARPSAGAPAGPAGGDGDAVGQAAEDPQGP